MRKKLLALSMAVILAVGSFTGCGSDSDGDDAASTPAATAGGSSENKPASDEGGDAEQGSAPVVGDDVVQQIIDNTSGTVTLTVWASELDQDFTNKLVDNFKALYPTVSFDITVEAESESTCKDTVLTDVTAAADVYTFADDQITDLVKAGALLEIQANYTYDVAKSNSTVAVSASSYDGKLYAYPMTADNTYYLFYDKSVFTPEDVQSLDKMVEVAKAANKQIGFEFANAWYLYGWFAGAGLEAYAGDGANVCNWNDAKGVDVAQAIMDYCATGVVTKSADDTSSVTAVKEGQYAAVVNGIWNKSNFESAWGDNYGAAKLPTFTANGNEYQMNAFLSCKLIGVNPHSEFPVWSMLLAEYLTSEEAQRARFEEKGYGPSNLVVAESDEVKASEDIGAVAAQSMFAQPQRILGNFWTPAATLGDTLAAGGVDDIQSLLDEAVAGITAP